MYKCPVCKQMLEKIDNSYKCLNGHSFDVNKKQYVNLLLPNQIHSLNPGDSKEMIEARTKFLNKGYYEELQNELVKVIDDLINDSEIFCDLACGEGYYTQKIHQALSYKHITSYGVDLSKFGISEATRKMRVEKTDNIHYCIGNLMYLPYMDKSMNVVLNCFAPFFEDEFARIIKDNGYFIRVLPNIDHMYELKKSIYLEVKLNEIKPVELEKFELVFEKELRYKKEFINNDDLLHLFMMTPLYYKSSLNVIEKIKSIENLVLTLSFKVLVYKKK